MLWKTRLWSVDAARTLEWYEHQLGLLDVVQKGHPALHKDKSILFLRTSSVLICIRVHQIARSFLDIAPKPVFVGLYSYRYCLPTHSRLSVNMKPSFTVIP
jgi:hypothetical protein